MDVLIAATGASCGSANDQLLRIEATSRVRVARRQAEQLVLASAVRFDDCRESSWRSARFWPGLLGSGNRRLGREAFRPSGTPNLNADEGNDLFPDLYEMGTHPIRALARSSGEQVGRTGSTRDGPPARPPSRRDRRKRSADAALSPAQQRHASGEVRRR